MKRQILGIFFLSTLLTAPVFAGYDDPFTDGINEGAISWWKSKNFLPVTFPNQGFCIQTK